MLALSVSNDTLFAIAALLIIVLLLLKIFGKR